MARMIEKLLAALLLSMAPAGVLAHAQEENTAPAAAPAVQPDIYDAQVVARYPHDPQAFMQGLLWHDGYLYESTGQIGQSQIRQIDLETGEVLARSPYPADMFGEGLTLWGEELLSLTWRNGTILRWKLSDLSDAGRYADYPFEGWGLTTLGDDLVASDGSATLRFLDPESFAVRREVVVTYNGKPLTQINELEAVDGLIYANVWHTGFIVAIDPANGVVRRVIDLRPLVESVAVGSREAVLNGIAHDPQTGRWFVTGKLWPSLFEVRFIPRVEAETEAP